MFQNLLMAAHHAESNGNTVLDSDFSCSYLVAHQAHDLSVRANENQVVGFAGFGQFRAFGKETIARMDGINTSIQGCINDFSYIKIGVLQCASTQRTCFVGHAPMQGIGVVVSEDSHRSDMQLAQCLDDSDRNFATVGNQDFIDSFTVHIAIMTPQIYKKKDNLCRLSSLFLRHGETVVAPSTKTP